MTTSFLIISLILTAYLGVYALVFVFLSIRIWFVKNKKIENVRKNYGSVSILIPAYNEGEAVVDTVNTIVKQDYQGTINIYVLANNTQDNFVKPLKKFYKHNDINSGNKILKLFASEKRNVLIIFTEQIHKKDKINFWTPNTFTDFIGLLDADHRADNNWISSSLSKMIEENTNAVQSRRQPLNVATIFQIWDSAQNHIGNEIVNFVLDKTSHSVFFTGTTCIFKSDVFKKFKFGENLTEDTYFSYDLICSGEKISYNSDSSSYEEVAFDAKSYLFRRRRWSAGHTKTFIDHFKKIFKAPLGFIEKIKLLIHGQFFLVPVVIAFILNLHGIYFFRQFTQNIHLAVLLIATLVSLAISTYFYKKGNNFIIDSAVSFFWIFPQVSILAIWIYKIFGSEIYHYIISFPLTKVLFPLEITLLFIPLLMLISGLFYFKQFKNYKNLLLIPTYIIFMFLDIYACLLGFADFIFGKYNWVEIKRQNFISQDLVPESVRSEMSTGKTTKTNYKKFAWAMVGIVAIFLTNDLLAFGNCGDTKAFLWKPIFIKPSSSIILNLDIEKRIVSSTTLEVLIKNKYTSASEITIESYLDDKLISEKKVIGNGEYTKAISDLPLGWESHKVNTVVKNPTVSCLRTNYFSTSFKEIKGNSLYVNGEKFLIKGIIPSFSNNVTNLSLDLGFEQIKKVGANTVRFYHSIGDEIKNNATKYNLMIIDQPDQSTWDEFSLDNFLSRNFYLSRYNKMVKKSEGYPFLLLNGLGNEWELGGSDPVSIIPKVKDFVAKTLSSSTDSELSSYSTYLTFVNYPVDILGVNMLDTGSTYWNKALNILENMNKPFYASEFGGFVAFWETVPADLRIARFTSYWNDLLNAGGLGANFFESHDNWAQPVVDGYNDPFKSDQPDDTRGLWDKDNNEKLELKFLREIFSDFQINVIDETISLKNNEVGFQIKNKREYALKDVVMNYRNTEINIGDFKPSESKIVKLPIDPTKIVSPKIQLVFDYTTHSGFEEISTNDLVLPIVGDKPIITNSDFVEKESSSNDITGRLIDSNKIEIIIPESWKTFEFNGKTIGKNGVKMELPVENPYHNVSDLQFSEDGLNWMPFDSNKIGGGHYLIRFKLPKISNSEKYLILTGLGADKITIDYGSGNFVTFNTFNYRENIINLSTLGQEIFNNYITLGIDRQQTVYITKEDSPSGKEILVNMERPKVFSPADIEIRKI